MSKTIEKKMSDKCIYHSKLVKTDRQQKIDDNLYKKYMKLKPKTVERYSELNKRGFSNKQISVFWKCSLMSIAGYAAHAKRKGLV